MSWFLIALVLDVNATTDRLSYDIYGKFTGQHECEQYAKLSEELFCIHKAAAILLPLNEDKTVK